MNTNMYPNYPINGMIPSQSTQPPIQNIPTDTTNSPLQNMNGSFGPNQQPPYAENILKQNKGKIATFYMSYSDSIEWRDKKFTGIIEDSGRDYAIISEPNTNRWWLLWLVYVDYIEFNEPINHF